MFSTDQAAQLRGATVVGPDGEKIGSVEEIYLDDDTGQPEWLTVKTGLFGSRVSFVPLADARVDGDTVQVPYDKAHVKDAPNTDADGQLTISEEEQLYAHYGRDAGVSGASNSETEGSGRDEDDAMTRSEEELSVGTERVEASRVRLRKYVVTEQVQTTVPVQHEEVRLEREPITDANRDAALDGPEITEAEHEVVLHEERPVVEKRVVPKERVRLGTDVVTDEHQVSEEIRKERIETDDGRGA
jgi:uncharacterized protein (TIGR02271 family)